MPLWHKNICAWISTNQGIVHEQSIYVDYNTDIVNCYIAGMAGQTFTVWWRNNDKNFSTSTILSLDGITVPGKILQGVGTARRSGSRVSGNTERPFVFEDLTAGLLTSEVPMDNGVITLTVTRVKLLERQTATALAPLPSTAVLGKRKAVCGFQVGFGEEALTVPRQDCTWKIAPLEVDTLGSPPKPFVTFVFRYRSLEYLHTRGLLYPPTPFWQFMPTSSFPPPAPVPTIYPPLVPQVPNALPFSAPLATIFPTSTPQVPNVHPHSTPPVPNNVSLPIPPVSRVVTNASINTKRRKLQHVSSTMVASPSASAQEQDQEQEEEEEDHSSQTFMVPNTVQVQQQQVEAEKRNDGTIPLDPTEAANRVRQELLAKLPPNYMEDPMYEGIVQFLQRTNSSLDSTATSAPSTLRKTSGSKARARRPAKSRTASAANHAMGLISHPQPAESTSWTGESLNEQFGDYFDFQGFTDDSNTSDST
ncbi:hypothetical protein BDN70DRAFT_883194 [Pholiota conissans]|uniref:Uncharacterized protein n=1 Tax=Pholiota conissans TaxID=109636 RepID=A0A9P5YU44_9AGAR|nr:hypothetical protein BDN70DRAFT_883194 [Pholiota conissans]